MKITINGVTINAPAGSSVSVVNGQVIVGDSYTSDKIVGPISITVKGNSGPINTVSGSVSVSGSVNGEVRSTSGNIQITGDVASDVSSTSGDIRCGSIKGSVSTTTGNITQTAK